MPAPSAEVNFSRLDAGIYRLRIHRTGFRADDAYSAYLDMGAPKELTPEQLEELKKLTRDLPETDRTLKVGKSGTFKLSISMHTNDVVLVTLERIKK